MGRRLEYASTSTQIHRDADVVTTSFPLYRSTTRLIGDIAAAAFGLAIVLPAIFLPGGRHTGFFGTWSHPGGAAPRLAAAAIGLAIILIIRHRWRLRHRRVELWLSGHTLRCTEPHSRKDKEAAFDLRTFRSAGAFTEGDAVGLALRGANGVEDVTVFSIEGYRQRDLEPVAEVVNAAIDGAHGFPS